VRAILTYHSLDQTGSAISIRPDVFRSHVRFLSSGRVRVVPLRELPACHTGAVALTFDDGFENFESEAMPLLADHGLSATVFVVTDRAGGTNGWQRPGDGIPSLPLMSWDAVGRIRQQGVEIGSHSRRHPDLTRASGSELEDEIAGAAERIEAAIGARPASFAYPYGRYDRRALRVVRSAYDLACTTELAFVEASSDRAALPRLDMYYFRDSGQLEAWGTPPFRRRVWVRAQGRRVRRLAERAGVSL
jgi:peptidoglycan/xylan/chitin deacetylase (PgdA/CDA1 family)